MSTTIVEDWSYWEERFPADVVQIMRACVFRDDLRYALTMPFITVGRAFATDGRIMVSWPTDIQGDVGRDEKLVDPWRALELSKFDEVHSWVSSSTFEVPAYKGVRCSKCEGTSIWQCPECDHEHDCNLCENGRIEDEQFVFVNGLKFNSRYLRALGPTFDLGFFQDHPEGTAAFVRLPHDGLGRLMSIRTK